MGHLIIIALGSGLFVVIIRIISALHVKITRDDAWEHLLVMKHFRKLKRIPKNIPEYYPCNEYYYPPLSYLFGCLLSNRTIEQKGYIVSAALEGILGICLGTAIWYYTRNYLAVSLSIIFYVAAPLLATNGLDWNPRTLGAGLAGFGLTAVAILPENYGWIVGGVLFILTALTHRMSSQVVWIVALIMSIIFKSPQWIASAIMGEVGAFLFYPRLYFRIRHSHFQMLFAWFIAFKEYSNEPRLDIKCNLMRVLTYCIGPLGILIISLFLFINTELFKNQQLLQLAWINGISALLAFSTSVIKDLLFLGEGERYPMNTVIPTAFFLAFIIHLLLPYSSTLFYLLIIATLIGHIAGWFTALYKAAIVSKKAVKISQDEVYKIASICKKLELKGRFICMPYYLNRRFAYEGLECFQLTPGAILSIPKRLRDYPFRAFQCFVLYDNTEFANKLMKSLEIHNYIAYLPENTPPQNMKLIQRIEKWGIYSNK